MGSGLCSDLEHWSLIQPRLNLKKEVHTAWLITRDNCRDIWQGFYLFIVTACTYFFLGCHRRFIILGKKNNCNVQYIVTGTQPRLQFNTKRSSYKKKSRCDPLLKLKCHPTPLKIKYKWFFPLSLPAAYIEWSTQTWFSNGTFGIMIFEMQLFLKSFTVCFPPCDSNC